MRVVCLRLIVAGLATILIAPPGVADDQAASCTYMKVAALPVKYVGANMEPTIPGSVNGDLYAAQGKADQASAVLAAHPDCKLAPRLALATRPPEAGAE